MELADYSHSLLSAVPAVLALLLAVATRRVPLPLGTGIILSAMLLAGRNPLNTLLHLKDMTVGLVQTEGGWSLGKFRILIFLLLLDVFTSLLAYSGSNQAFADQAKHHIRDEHGAKMLMAGLVFVIFIDDYFHGLVVGAIARPVADKFKISRAKLAYILDSTAASMCVLMPVSGWGASIIATLVGLLITYKITGYTPMGTFVVMSLMNYYALFALIMVFVVAWFPFDVGSMAHLEHVAQHENHDGAQISNGVKGRVYALTISILVLIFAIVSTTLCTGSRSLETLSILGVLENTDVNTSLVVNGLSGVAAVLLTTVGAIEPSDYGTAVWQGIRSIFGTITVLILVWLVSTVVNEMHTGKYLSTLVAGDINSGLLSVTLFLLVSVMAFATDTSWGTFGIMLPIVAAMAVKVDATLVIPCMLAVMVDVVCGDYCSPTSDTTILSSTDAHCNHMNRVTSQLPYVLTVATAADAGYLVLGFAKSALLGFAVTGVMLAVLILTLKSKNTAQKS